MVEVESETRGTRGLDIAPNEDWPTSNTIPDVDDQTSALFNSSISSISVSFHDPPHPWIVRALLWPVVLTTGRVEAARSQISRLKVGDNGAILSCLADLDEITLNPIKPGIFGHLPQGKCL